MLDVYYSQRWYNMDWLVVIVVCWNWCRICWAGGRKGGGLGVTILGDGWRRVGECFMSIFISKGYLLWGRRWDCVCQCKYHSFAASFYLSRIYVYKIVRVYWVNDFFVVVCIMSMVSAIVPYAWPASSMCWVYFDVWLLVLMAWICSLYRSLNVRPVCPMYLSGHSLHFSWYTLPFWYMSVIWFF
jgi:hypothetical protein